MSAQDLLLKRYGPPGPEYQKKYCEVWDIRKEFSWFPATKILINKDFRAVLTRAFANLEKAGLQSEIQTYDGCYNDRSVRGKTSTSLHAWAAAIDLNADKERLAQEETHWSGQFIAIMKAAGLFWGGDWHSRKDSMHFALYNG